MFGLHGWHLRNSLTLVRQSRNVHKEFLRIGKWHVNRGRFTTGNEGDLSNVLGHSPSKHFNKGVRNVKERQVSKSIKDGHYDVATFLMEFEEAHKETLFEIEKAVLEEPTNSFVHFCSYKS